MQFQIVTDYEAIFDLWVAGMLWCGGIAQTPVHVPWRQWHSLEDKQTAVERWAKDGRVPNGPYGIMVED